jgi:inorganic pyrophosphatase
VPRTFCDKHTAKLSATADRGDGDPLDICVVTERPINRSEVLVNARVVGGIDVNDGGEADDKIIAVLENDYVWGKAEDITDLPPVLVERLRHYFSTYKMIAGEPTKLTVERVYGRDHALKVVEASMLDYYEEYGQ